MADALSRAPVKATPVMGEFDEDIAMDNDQWWFQAKGTKLEEAELVVLDVAMPIDRNEWRQAQLADKFCQKTEQDIQKR